ncbi:hypothetical protein EVAR_2824_1 [Eumeta japonica]|uniref:Uncharacterized protein n=1 Tax=Eumeta variegata TaxID=151549 RepID=A0A4C1SZU3_EUMVA|nr:hypothetical protein EVAR_2824_1 [Eumeta japonica]
MVSCGGRAAGAVRGDGAGDVVRQPARRAAARPRGTHGARERGVDTGTRRRRPHRSIIQHATPSRAHAWPETAPRAHYLRIIPQNKSAMVPLEAISWRARRDRSQTLWYVALKRILAKLEQSARYVKRGAARWLRVLGACDALTACTRFGVRAPSGARLPALCNVPPPPPPVPTPLRKIERGRWEGPQHRRAQPPVDTTASALWPPAAPRAYKAHGLKLCSDRLIRSKVIRGLYIDARTHKRIHARMHAQRSHARTTHARTYAHTQERTHA